MSNRDLQNAICNLVLDFINKTCNFRFTANRLRISVADKKRAPHTRPLEPYLIYCSLILFSSVSFILIETLKYAIYIQRYIFLILPKQLLVFESFFPDDEIILKYMKVLTFEHFLPAKRQLHIVVPNAFYDGTS